MYALRKVYLEGNMYRPCTGRTKTGDLCGGPILWVRDGFFFSFFEVDCLQVVYWGLAVVPISFCLESLSHYNQGNSLSVLLWEKSQEREEESHIESMRGDTLAL